MLVLLALMEVHITSAQTDNCTPGVANGIRTNPENAVNPDCPAQANTFDWRQTYYPYYWSSFPHVTQVQSPFWNISGFNDDLWHEENGGKDYQPADGWELIKKGVAPEVENQSYVVLYNRFTSILRVVFALPPVVSHDYPYISVKISFPESDGASIGKMTALLHPTTGLSQPMDQFSIGNAQSTVRYPLVYDIFMYADFPVEYDPCTCLQNSKLEILFERIINQSLFSYNTTTDRYKSIIGIENYHGIVEDDLLTKAYASDVFLKGLGGAHTFSTYEHLLGEWYRRQRNTGLGEPYALFEIFNELVRIKENEASPFLRTIKAIGAAQLREDVLLGININGFDPDIGLSGAAVLDRIAEMTNIFGAPVKTQTHWNGNFKILGNTIFSERGVTFNGNINTDSRHRVNAIFRTPGEATDCRDKMYPVYNEALGRFALLETPAVEVQIHETLEHETPEGVPNARTEVRIRLRPETIKYTLNPAAKIAPGTEIWAALRITAGMSPGENPFSFSEQTTLVPLSCIGGYTFDATFRRPYTQDAAFEITEVQLVLFADYQFEGLNSDNEIPRALAIYTYPVIAGPNQRIETENALWPATPDYPDHFVPDNCAPLLPEESSRILTFCQQKYQGNRSRQMIPAPTPNDPVLPFSIHVYPNPTKHQANLQIVLPEVSEVVAHLRTLSGQMVRQVFTPHDLPAGEHLFDLNLHDLASGMYLLSVQTGQGKRTVRVVKQ